MHACCHQHLPLPSLAAVARLLSREILQSSSPYGQWTATVEQYLCRPPAALTADLIAATIDPHLLPHRHLAAGLFNWASQQPQFTHSAASYHALLKTLPNSPSQIQSLLKSAKTSRISLYSASYRLAIESLVRSGRPNEAVGLLDLAGDGLPDTVYNSLLACLSSFGFFGDARKVFDRMLERGIVFNEVGFGAFVRSVCELDGVLAIIDEVIERNCDGINGSVVAAVVVDRLCRLGRIEEAWRGLEEFRRRGWKPDFIAYRIVSEGFRLAGRMDESEEILKQKRKFGVAPRMNDYRDFILSAVSERRILEAKELGEAIISGEFPIDEDVLNALVGSVSRIDSDSSVLFCKYMISKDWFPSVAMLSSLCRNLCKNEKSNEMWDLFRELMSKKYCTTVEHYNVMISFLCKTTKVREAYDVLKEMKKSGFNPDTSSYNYMIDACCRDDMLRPARKLWDEMFTNGCSANLQTYNILIRKFSEEGAAEDAHELFNHMLVKGVLPNSLTYASVVQVLCQENRMEEAIVILNKSIEQDVVMGSSTLSSLILFLCKQAKFEIASSLLQGLPRDAESLDSHVILLKALADSGHVEMAIKHLEWIKDTAYLKLQNIVTKLMAALSTAPNLDPYLQLLRAMHVRHLVSTDNPWMNLLEGYSI